MLKSLPQHEPPESVWAHIEAHLPLVALPQHEPPDAIWDMIEEQLAAKPEVVVRRLPFFKVHTFRIAVAAAVTVLIVALAGIFTMKKYNQTTEIVSQEVLDDRLNVKNLGPDDKAFAAIEEICKSALPQCETPKFKTLKQELDDLNVAKEQLTNAIGNYNSDADLVVQLTEIENQRSEIVNQMYALVE
jgi:hypothetical protein